MNDTGVNRAHTQTHTGHTSREGREYTDKSTVWRGQKSESVVVKCKSEIQLKEGGEGCFWV